MSVSPLTRDHLGYVVPPGAVVLGISGLAHSKDFKRTALPGLSEAEYDIYQGADSAAALAAGGEVVAAGAEERFRRDKHTGAFPIGAAEFCLRFSGLEAADVDLVAHSFSYGPHAEAYRELSPFYRSLYDEVLSPSVNRSIAEEQLSITLDDKFLAVPHHLAHAASAYWPSGFDDALVLVTDGLGERTSASVMHGSAQGFEMLTEISAGNSLGLLYGIFTMYLGFRFGEGEYKVMGLAPYGDPHQCAQQILDHWVHLTTDGRYVISLLQDDVTDIDRETHRRSIEVIEGVFGPRRTPGAPMEQHHMDIAAGLQAVTQLCQMHVLSHWRSETGLSRLCMAGGVGLNCVANGVIQRSRLFDDVYVQPAAGDDGAAIGAALYGSHHLGTKPQRSFTPLLGPRYADSDIEQVLSSYDDIVGKRYDEDALLDEVTSLLEGGAVVGWFQGAMEFGPRALGNRSILADPRRPDMRDTINSMVKKRESFRPFAPVIPVEDACRYFEIDDADAQRFADMLFVAYVRPEVRELLPSTTHVDGSARVQTVDPERNERFWKLLRRFGDRTGTPVLLNTSFNVGGQAIVESPVQAIDTFMAAGLDVLVLGDVVVRWRGARSS